MTTTTDKRELAFRENHGVSVSLFWDAVGDSLTLEVYDEGNDEILHLRGLVGPARGRAGAGDERTSEPGPRLGANAHGRPAARRAHACGQASAGVPACGKSPPSST
jgi:hypothetical protein